MAVKRANLGAKGCKLNYDANNVPDKIKDLDNPRFDEIYNIVRTR